MDFITFMIKVKLDGVTDAHDRSEGVASIVQTISLIGDPITRASYIQDCASRLGFSEQTLTQRMNEEIKNYREEQRKIEARRQLEQEAASRGYSQPPSGQWVDGAAQQPPAAANAQEVDDPYYGNLPPEAFSSYPGDGQTAASQPSTSQPSTSQQPAASQQYASQQTSYTQPQPKVAPKVIRENVSDLLMKMVIQHGSDIVLENVESEDGSLINLNVAQYIDYSLSQDNMQFSLPLYNNILSEAVEQSLTEGFNSEAYFTRHPDYEVSSLALKLTDDVAIPAQSESEATTKKKYSKEHMLDKVEHLLLDFRYEYIDARLKQLRAEITTATPDRQMELMKEMQQAQKLRAAIAKKIGSCLR